jgi:hypothetical protein
MNTAILGLDIYENNSMFLGHWVMFTADFYFQQTFTTTGHTGKMFFGSGIDGVSHKFLHFFSTAHDRHTRIDHLHYHIAKMSALIKFCCHNPLVYNKTFLRNNTPKQQNVRQTIANAKELITPTAISKVKYLF